LGPPQILGVGANRVWRRRFCGLWWGWTGHAGL